MRRRNEFTSEKTVIENRICTILQDKLYSMACDDNQKEYESLELKWTLPLESSNGICSIFKNVIYVLEYVQKSQCSEKCIHKIIENDIYPIVSRLRNEYDFMLAVIVLVLCREEIDYSNETVVKKFLSEVLAKYLDFLELAYSQLEDSVSKESTVNDGCCDDYMDTSNLEVGLVIQNGYSGLCRLVGEKCYKSGSNQRKAQEKRFKRFIKWEKSEFHKRTIVITDIYDEPLPKDDKRKLGNNNIYLKYIETILLRYVYYKNTDNQICYITKNQLWRILGMINENYKKIPYSILTSDIEYSDIKKWELNNFYMRCNSKLNSILYSALNSLKDRSLIDWSMQTMIVVPPDEEEKYSHHYVANDNEIKKILSVERKVLKDMGFESKSHVMCKMKMQIFYDNVNKLLFELYGWERKYERIKLNFNKKDVKEALLQDEYKLQRLLLNDLIIEAVDKNAQSTVDKRMEKALVEYEEYTKNYFGTPPKLEEVKDIFTYPKYFVDIQKRLSQKFLSIKHAEEENEINGKTIPLDQEIEDLFRNLGVE